MIPKPKWQQRNTYFVPKRSIILPPKKNPANAPTTNKFPIKTISTFDHRSTSFSIKLKICGQAPVKRVSKKQYAQNGRYPGILRTFKKLTRNDSFLTVLLSNSGIC